MANIQNWKIFNIEGSPVIMYNDAFLNLRIEDTQNGKEAAGYFVTNVDKKIVVKDVRIFVNTISRAVDTMRMSGIDAVSNKEETDDYIEYTVKIPKETALEKSRCLKVLSS